MNIKIEDNNVNKIQGINDLIFPIITIRKPEENKNSECDSLSALNKALSKSQIWWMDILGGYHDISYIRNTR